MVLLTFTFVFVLENTSISSFCYTHSYSCTIVDNNIKGSLLFVYFFSIAHAQFSFPFFYVIGSVFIRFFLLYSKIFRVFIFFYGDDDLRMLVFTSLSSYLGWF